MCYIQYNTYNVALHRLNPSSIFYDGLGAVGKIPELKKRVKRERAEKSGRQQYYQFFKQPR